MRPPASSGPRLLPSQLLTERHERLGHDMLGVEAGLIVLQLGLVVFHDAVWHAHWPKPEAASVQQPRMRQELHDMSGEAADRIFFHRDQHFMLARETTDEVRIERLAEARIGNRRRKAAGLKLIRGLQRFMKARAVGENCDGGPFAHDAAAVLVQLQALGALSAWVHGVLIALMLTVFFALTEFAWQRGITRPAIRAGLIAYAVGVVAMTGAALVDGFVTPRVAILGAGLRAADLSITAQLLNLCILFNQALARLGAIAMSAAIIAWSLDLLLRAGLERALGVVGLDFEVDVSFVHRPIFSREGPRWQSGKF